MSGLSKSKWLSEGLRRHVGSLLWRKQFRTLVGDLTIGLLLTGHCRPTLFFYRVTSLPGTHLFQFFELLVFPRILFEPDDTNRCQAPGDSVFSHHLSHFPSSAPGNQSAPSEA